MIRMNRVRWLVVGAWVAVLAVLVIGLQLIEVNSVLVGGALGAFCGATLVVVYGAWERAKAATSEPTSSVLDERYGRRRR